jgi:hypothetical protein
MAKKRGQVFQKTKCSLPQAFHFSKHPPFVDAIYFRTYPPNTLPNVL